MQPPNSPANPHARWSRSPALPPHDLFEVKAARRKLGFRVLAGRRVAHGDGAYGPIPFGHTQRVHEIPLAGEEREEEGTQAEVDGSEQDQHDPEASIDVPVRHRPGALA